MQVWFRPSTGLSHNISLFCVFPHQGTNIFPTEHVCFSILEESLRINVNVADTREHPYHFERIQKVSYGKSLARVEVYSKDVYLEKFLWDVFWLNHQFYKDTITHTPTSQQFGILSVVCNLYASHLAPFSLVPSQYQHHSEQFVLLEKDNVIRTSQNFRNSVTMMANSDHREKINFFTSTSDNITLYFTVWSKSLRTWQDHTLERTWLVLALCEELALTLILQSCIQTSRHWLAHSVGLKLTGIYSYKRIHRFVGFRFKISSTWALRVKFLDGVPTTLSRIFCRKSSSVSVNW